MNIVGNQWIDFNDEWYYFDSNLNPYNGVHKIGDKTYFFWSDGRLAITDTEGFLSSIKSDNKLVLYNNKGEVVECVDIVGNQWIEFNGGKYYFDSNLNPYQGIQTIDGVEYFFTYEGQLAEYMDGAEASKDTLVYVKDGKVIAKTKIEDEKLTYLYENIITIILVIMVIIIMHTMEFMKQMVKNYSLRMVNYKQVIVMKY